jgi:predicted MFS family arabinose efflux permease
LLAGGPVTKPLRITLLLCGTEVLGLAGLATFAALLPTFIQTWELSNTQAGWLSAVYYGAYVVAVPILTAWTDRRDAKRILLFGLVIGSLANLGFAWAAAGFWSALILRFLSGVSLAGIYMPGLKLLSDHTEGSRQSRYVSFYTASFSLGTSLSYFLAGEIHLILGWRWAFAVAGFLTLAGCAMMMLTVPAGNTSGSGPDSRSRTRLRAVLSNRQAMAYVLAYAAHMWELFSVRSWMVAFLTYSRQIQISSGPGLSPTQVVALINLIGLPASIGGNELCRRLNRPRTLRVIMLASALVSLAVGFSANLPYVWVVCLVLVYGILMLGDSAALTAGAVASAPAGGRGTILAVHSTLGFGAAFLGPLATGIVLDLLRGNSDLAWGMAFICMGAGCALGPLALRLLKQGR